MNFFDYIDKYGECSFEEVEFNEIDNVIFAYLSYINFDGIVFKGVFNKITLKKAADKYFLLHSKREFNLLSLASAIKMLNAIKDTKRYGNLYLYNYVYELSDNKQFSAVTIEINPRLVYVSFEGTDYMVSGWKEDFMMAYKFPVAAQKKAIEYINKNFIFSNKKIILGGHSKGGNLALVAGMYANLFVRNKILKIYNNDGPGLLKEEFESKQYVRIKDKLITIMPCYSIVGILFHHSDDCIVVKSKWKGFFAHDIYNWVVNEKEFARAEMDEYNNALGKEMLEWLSKYNKEERERLVLALFDIFEKAEIENLLEINLSKRVILDLISSAKELDEVDRVMLKDFFGMIINCFKEVKINEVKNFINKIKS